MSTSIEVQIINKILTTKSTDILATSAIDSSYFSEFKKVIEFIISHKQTYDNIPDAFTIASKFDKFPLMEVTESDQYLLGQLLEQKLYKDSVPVIQNAAQLLSEDSHKATEYLLTNLEALKSKYQSQNNRALDIVDASTDRLDEYRKRVDLKGLLGISTGVEGLDKILNGFLPEDLVIILARTNEGKSWLLLFLLVNAWKQGKSVLLYSGEMSKIVVGFRFDALNANMSNKDLMIGQAVQKKDKSLVDYDEYIMNLSSTNVPFYVITPKELNGKDLTVPMTESLIKQYKPDIVGLDQLSLMEDYRRGENKRVQLGNITKDLYKVTETYQIPILSVAQANREADKEKKKNTVSVPALSQIADSDDIARNATRVLSIGQIDDMLKIKNVKNRYGVVGQELLMNFDFNFGIFEEMEGEAEHMAENQLSKDTALF